MTHEYFRVMLMNTERLWFRVMYGTIAGTLSSPDQCSSSGVWYCCETLELVIELAEACPSFLRPRVAQCVRGMVQVRRRVVTSVFLQSYRSSTLIICVVRHPLAMLIALVDIQFQLIMKVFCSYPHCPSLSRNKQKVNTTHISKIDRKEGGS